MEMKSKIQSLCAQVQSLHEIIDDNRMLQSREKSIYIIRVVYESAQSLTGISPPSIASEELHRLISLLSHVVMAEELPFDASVLASSSIVLLLPHVHPGYADIHFRNFYLNISRHHSNNIHSFVYAQATDNTICSSCCPDHLRSGGVQSLLAFLQGFLKISPDWIFRKESAIHILDVIPLLVNLVGSVGATWLYQLFIILELWSARVTENLALILSSCNDKKTASFTAESLLNVCSLYEKKPGSLFKVLSTHWECPVKGVPGLCINILSNMIGIFDGIAATPPSPSRPLTSGTNIVLNNVLNSALWSSRASYASLQSLLLGHHLTAQQLVEKCGRELCEGMCGGLRSSHLATCVTALYRPVVAALAEETWLSYFLEGFVAALTSHSRTTQHNLMTLWLPVTLQRHPALWQRLLTACPNSDSGWLAKLAVLRSAPSALSPHMLCLGTQDCVLAQVASENVDSPTNKLMGRQNGGNFDLFNGAPFPAGLCPPLVLCPAAAWLEALDHPVPAVRADALALLCTQAKGHSISEQQATLIQDFFVFNVNIDCSIFRLSVVKSFKHLMARLREALCKWVKPFKRELEHGNKIPCDKIHAELMVSSKLVVWFVRFLHHQLGSDGNYQRKIISLQLYKAMILSFHSSACKNKKRTESAAMECVLNFLALHSAEEEWGVQERMFLACGRLGPSNCRNFRSDDFHTVMPVSSGNGDSGNFRKCALPITDFSLPHTIPLIISYLKHEMNDVRDESEELLSLFSEKAWLLYVRNAYFSINKSSQNIHPLRNVGQYYTFSNENFFESSPNSAEATVASSELSASSATDNLPSEDYRVCVVFSQLLLDAVALLECPKMSLAESGALTVRVVVAAVGRLRCASRVSLHQVLRRLSPSAATLTSFSDDPSLALMGVLLAKAQEDLTQARHNLLCAATAAPIYGSVLALATVLGSMSYSTNSSSTNNNNTSSNGPNSRCTSRSTRPALEQFLPKVLLFCEEAVCFMLDSMALAAKEGAAVAPSFSEISESIERIIIQCREASPGAEGRASPGAEGRASPGAEGRASPGAEGRASPGSHGGDACSLHELDDDGEEAGAISSDHQLVLSCCWQTIRAACMLCSTVLCSPLVRVIAAPASKAAAASGILPTNSACNSGSGTAAASVSGILSTNAACDVDSGTAAASPSGILSTNAACDVDSDAAAAAVSGISPTTSACDATHRTDSVQAGGEVAHVCLSTAVVTRAVDAVLIRTLTGTRHKGAIEAAKVCLSNTAQVLLKRPLTYNIVADLVEATLNRELDLVTGSSLTSQRRSVTRRAAGLAMLTQAVCVAAATVAGRRAKPSLLLRTLDTLLQHASHHTQESELGDCRCSVVLHLLQGLVQQLQHCPYLGAIAAACISAFTSTCWRCRNAGLQLFGGVVSRLVGQKKVSQDSSEYNSITAPQFIAAHPQLARSVFQLLRFAARAATRESGCANHEVDPACQVEPKRSSESCHDGDHGELLLQFSQRLVMESEDDQMLAAQKNNGDCEEMRPEDKEDRSEFVRVLRDEVGFQAHLCYKSEVELSSAVLPVLCLLSRLSPGLQLSLDNFTDITVGFQECLSKLLASSIVNIRSLAAISLLSLTPQAQQKSLMGRILDRLDSRTSSLVEKTCETKTNPSIPAKSNFIFTNETHGLLLVVKAYIERSFKVDSSENVDTNHIRRTLAALYSNENECYVIRALACECLLLLSDRTSLSIDERSLTRGRIHSPGYERFVELSFVYLLRVSSESGMQIILYYLTSGSYFIAEIVSNFWIENILQRKVTRLSENERNITHSLVHLVLSNEMREKSDLLLKILHSYFEAKVLGNDLWAGMTCTAVCAESLLLILRGNLNASTHRNLLILMSHLLGSSCITLPDDVFSLFCENVVKFSKENYNEEFRLCSAKCVGVLLPCMMADNDVCGLRYLKEHIVQVVCDLLYDEDPGVRDAAASEFSSVFSSSPKHPLHPNKALVALLEHFAQQCVLKNDSTLLESLWTCYVDGSNKYAFSKVKADDAIKAYLFESDALNLYKENNVITQMLELTLLTVAQDPCCAQLLLRLCSISQSKMDSSFTDLNASQFSLYSRFQRIQSEVLKNVGNFKIQT